MSLLKRFGFYLAGLSIGLIIVAFIFKEKGTTFCYLPNCRVLKELRSHPLILDKQVSSQFPNDSLAGVEIKKILTVGEVDFSESKTYKKHCKEYLINNKKTSLKISYCDSLVIAKQLIKGSENNLR